MEDQKELGVGGERVEVVPAAAGRPARHPAAEGDLHALGVVHLAVVVKVGAEGAYADLLMSLKVRGWGNQLRQSATACFR